MNEYDDDEEADGELDDLWSIPVTDTPPPLPLPGATPVKAEEEAPVEETGFLLRGEDPPTDGVYRPRLRGFGEAA